MVPDDRTQSPRIHPHTHDIGHSWHPRNPNALRTGAFKRTLPAPRSIYHARSLPGSYWMIVAEPQPRHQNLQLCLLGLHLQLSILHFVNEHRLRNRFRCGLVERLVVKRAGCYTRTLHLQTQNLRMRQRNEGIDGERKGRMQRELQAHT